MTYLLSCPHCHFSIRPLAAFLMVDYCPRCLAKRRVAEPLRQPDDSSAPGRSLPRAEKPTRFNDHMGTA
jgi:hypothetical protein